MNWKGHAIFALLLGLPTAYILGCDFLHFLLYIPLLVFSALLPDVDLRQSKARTLANSIAVLFAIFYGFVATAHGDLATYVRRGWYVSAALLGIYFIIVEIAFHRHRGFTHTLLSASAYSLVLYLLLGQAAAAFAFVGYASHLVADGELRVY